MNIFRLILFYFLAFLLFSCSSQEKDREIFIQTYKEIIIAKERFQDDSIKYHKALQKIFKKHDYDEESFEDDLIKYSKSSQEFINLLDSARERIKKDLKKYDKSHPNPARKVGNQ